ncbi:MAG: FAD-binding monooxygenase [Reyranella sp.]|uniref:FAD-dependent monooxygenase n=1 Tax=Reyranella sp. TaxID=1929291 RepID=UPI001201D193|nr:FAD-dependent monooxygenase [Reyranella sp.]TAJ87918.1 MAG: FAD-binding monooxygenase [Reyranella sp.]TBR29477.1 MAG: FAD-binding monooxygenase [Reyranella sp.]
MAGNPKVLISGAGPVGLTLANELARHGISARIVDRSTARTDKSKALVMWSRTLELFDDAGYAKDFMSSGMPAHGAQISTGRQVVARVPFDLIDSRFAYALMIAQSETERVLEERLATAGVTVERDVELTSFVDKGVCVEAVLTKAGGQRETLEADWLVGCDGAHSTVRHGLGFAFEGSTLQSHWALADGHVTGLDPADHLHIFWHRDGILAFFPIVGDRWRVIANLGAAKDGETRPDPTLEEINALMARRGSPGIVMSDPVWLAAFRINERKVRDYSRGRVFLAGDAAHIHSPAGGQGMNTGMQDAFNLAWKLTLVIEGAATPSLLDSYSPERTAVGDRVLKNAGRLTEAAMLRNPLLQDLRNTIVRFAAGFPQVQHRMADQLGEMDIGYPDSPLTARNGQVDNGPKAGERWPYRLPDGAGGYRFTAVGPAGLVADLAAKFPRLVVAAPTRDPAHATALRLIRPDGYVGFAGAPKDVGRAEAYLAALASEA